MKGGPIIFKGAMVQAILEDRKTQTRRLKGLEKINKCPDDHKKAIQLSDGTWSFWYPGNVDSGFANKAYPDGGGFKCPYGVPGDRLWVRETWANVLYHKMFYRADSDRTLPKGCKWKPSIQMFRWASRITLEITSVRVERLQDITRSDIRAEGLVCPKEYCSDDLEYNYKHWYHLEWIKLWDSINGKKYPWKSNPWIWVIGFKRIGDNGI